MTARDFRQHGEQIVEISLIKQCSTGVYSFKVIAYVWVGLLPEPDGAFETLSTLSSSEHKYFPRRLSETIAWNRVSGKAAAL